MRQLPEPLTTLNPTILSGMRCLVLGGGGFMGLALCRALSRYGAEIQGFGRTIAYPDALDPRVTWTTAQFADTSALAKAVQGQDVVFHLIGGSTPVSSTIGFMSDFDENTRTTVALLELCRSERVRKVIFASSGGTVYGAQSQFPISEDAPTNPISAYGVGKLVLEKLLFLYSHLYGLDYRVLRIGNAYGRYQSPFRKQGIVAAMLFRALSGRPLEIWGDGNIVRDFIHVDDVAMAFIHALLYSGEYRIMNVGSGTGRSMVEVAADICNLMAVNDLKIVHKPGRSSDVPVNILSVDLIRSETAWRPTVTWSDGLTATAHWVREALVT